MEKIVIIYLVFCIVLLLMMYGWMKKKERVLVAEFDMMLEQHDAIMKHYGAEKKPCKCHEKAEQKKTTKKK